MSRTISQFVNLYYLHDSFDPGALVVVLESDNGGVIIVEVPIQQEQVINRHDKKPNWDQDQIKILFLQKHNAFWCSNTKSISDQRHFITILSIPERWGCSVSVLL